MLALTSKTSNVAFSSPLHLILGFMMIRNYQGYRKIKSSVDDEKSALSVLDGLGSDYAVISDLEIELYNKRA